MASAKTGTAAVEYDSVGNDYLERRKLKKGVAGWVLLASLACPM